MNLNTFTRVLDIPSLINLKLSLLKLACHYLQQKDLSLAVGFQVDIYSLSVCTFFFFFLGGGVP